MKTSDSLPYVLLPLACVAFDKALNLSFINKNYVLRAVVDNSAHGLIAFLSWLAVVGVEELSKKDIAEMSLCAVTACAIDLDHFISAKSCSLKDALSLDQRPPLHSTSVVFPIVLFATGVAMYYPYLYAIPLIVTVSFVSHHVRDGCRRGLWFWPLGSTPPIPYWLFLVIILALPAIVSRMIKAAGARTILKINV